MRSRDQDTRLSLATAWLSAGAAGDVDFRTLLSQTAHWVMEGQWPGADAVAPRDRAARAPGGGLRASAARGRPIIPGSVAEGALAYFQGLIGRGEVLPGNPDIARALNIPDPDSVRAGRRVSQILGRIAAHQGWTIHHRGCAASGTFGRRIITPSGQATPWSGGQVGNGVAQTAPVEKVRETDWCSLSIVPLASLTQVTSSPPPALAVTGDKDSTSAADTAPKTMPDDSEGPAGELGYTLSAARIPEVDHVTAQADTGFAPEAAGARLGVAPAQGGGWPGGVVRDGARHIDHCATLAVEIVEAGEVLPSLNEFMARLKARYNGSWSACGDVASISSCFTALKKLGFCTIATRPEYPIIKGAPRVRQVTLWDGRVSALPPLPAPKPPARPVTQNMAAANARRAAEAAVVNPAGTRRKDKLAAILLRCIDAQDPVPSNVEIGQALDMPPNKTPDILAMLESDGFGRMQHTGAGWTLSRRYVLRDGRATPWSPPRNRAPQGGAPKPVTARAAPAVPAPVSPPPAAPSPTVAAGTKAAAPNRNTGIYDRRPAPAAKRPAGKDVSPELRAEIERRVAEGRFTRADKPGYAAPTDATAPGVPVYSTAGGGRRPGY